MTMTFLMEGGSTVVEQRTVAPQSRMTVHVDQIPGLEAASPSVQVTSTNGVPLVVERTMFWDQYVLRRSHRERRRAAATRHGCSPKASRASSIPTS